MRMVSSHPIPLQASEIISEMYLRTCGLGVSGQESGKQAAISFPDGAVQVKGQRTARHSTSGQHALWPRCHCVVDHAPIVSACLPLDILAQVTVIGRAVVHCRLVELSLCTCTCGGDQLLVVATDPKNATLHCIICRCRIESRHILLQLTIVLLQLGAGCRQGGYKDNDVTAGCPPSQ